MKKLKQTTVILITLLMLVACSGGPPSEGQAQTKLKNLIRKRSNGNITLVELSKTDGQMREKEGMQMYAMDVNGTIEIQKDCYWRPRYNIAAGKQFTSTTDMPKSELDKLRPKFAGEKSKAGDKYHLSGSITFDKKESGWNIAETALEVSK